MKSSSPGRSTASSYAASAKRGCLVRVRARVRVRVRVRIRVRVG
jgi:hypothetical protein